mgnify:CR=1 FL=1
MCVRVCDDVCAGVDGNVDAVRSWVASGADINVVDKYGNTPLMFASQGLRSECVAEMLRLGADARRVNNDGRTALHLTASADRGGDGGGVVRQLVAAGCDAAVRDNDGHTAVELARTWHGARAIAEWATVFEGWVAAAMA